MNNTAKTVERLKVSEGGQAVGVIRLEVRPVKVEVIRWEAVAIVDSDKQVSVGGYEEYQHLAEVFGMLLLRQKIEAAGYRFERIDKNEIPKKPIETRLTF